MIPTLQLFSKKKKNQLDTHGRVIAILKDSLHCLEKLYTGLKIMLHVLLLEKQNERISMQVLSG